jgi:hypothetical protein
MAVVIEEFEVLPEPPRPGAQPPATDAPPPARAAVPDAETLRLALLALREQQLRLAAH